MTDSVTDLGGLGVGAEDFLAAVLRTIAQPVWVVDHEGLIRFANPAAIAALGYDNSEDLIGRNSHETIHYRHPDGTPYPASECPMLLPRTSGATVARDLDWSFRRDGSMFPVSYVSGPIEMSQGRGAVVAFNDMSPGCGRRRSCGSETCAWARSSPRCGGWRRWWPAGRIQSRCSPAWPGR